MFPEEWKIPTGMLQARENPTWFQRPLSHTHFVISGNKTFITCMQVLCLMQILHLFIVQVCLVLITLAFYRSSAGRGGLGELPLVGCNSYG